MKKEEFQQNMKDRMQQFEDGGLRLLKKGQKGIVHAIFSRFGLVLLLMLLQVGVLWSVFRWFGGLLPHYFGGSVAMSAFMVVYILNSEMDNSAKITWMVTIAILPVVGVPLFFYVKSNIGHNALKKRVTHLTEEARGRGLGCQLLGHALHVYRELGRRRGLAGAVSPRKGRRLLGLQEHGSYLLPRRRGQVRRAAAPTGKGREVHLPRILHHRRGPHVGQDPRSAGPQGR